MGSISLLIAIGAGAGALIGCVGIGGVIVAPALVYLVGLSPQMAIAAALCAFIASGAVGVYAYARAGSIRWRAAAFTSLGALPAAFVGAWVVNVVEAEWLEVGIGLLTAGAGLHALTTGRRSYPVASEKTLSSPRLTGLGAATGLLSAVTGTGGPLVLVPILVWLEVPLLAAIGLAQVIQLPIAAAATAGNLLAGALHVRTAVALACGIAVGTWIGAKAAHAFHLKALRLIVASLLVLIGGAILLHVVLH